MTDGWTVVVLGGYNEDETELSTVQLIYFDNGTITGVDKAPDLPYQMADASVVTDENGQVFAVANRDLDLSYSDRGLIWGLASDFKHKRWNKMPKPMIKRVAPITFKLSNVLYLTGGPGYMECIDLKDINSGWKNCGPSFPQSISEASSCVMDDWAWFSGGLDGFYSHTSAVYRWKPDDGWERMTNMSKERISHGMTSDGKRIYVIGGLGIWTNVDVFDPADNRWYVLSELSVPLFHIGAVYLPWGQIIVPGGRGLEPGDSFSDPYVARNVIYLYDILEDSWSSSSVKLNQAVHSAGIALCNSLEATSPRL